MGRDAYGEAMLVVKLGGVPMPAQDGLWAYMAIHEDSYRHPGDEVIADDLPEHEAHELAEELNSVLSVCGT
jgi:hypothetical protein